MTSSTAVEQPQQQQQEESPSLLMSFTSVFSNLLPSAKADDSEEKDDDAEEPKDDGETEEGGDESEEAEEEEEDEPEDPAPAIYEACENSSKCKPAKTHFDHCQERVSEGKGFHGEDCIEEFCACNGIHRYPPRPLRFRMLCT
ncbi:ubiquinol--cytochrome-c reductase subunit 6 [Tilletia horrida]|uniref:Ubiquinol--cytochrome-c reductase subunit 6 n=1 Tax=Tilletia horrida TaxID=155126 RepID=A0AAN6GTC7_9BASI|nr:ubiquinol--cytochrome-c reductase subunit 6 [Tilletia horrida]KAK0555327.1 ubiquinol--cytochrome-c reductase subunit 6 [Tilletia horrida]